MTEERIKSLIIQYDDLIRYRKQLLDYEFVRELLSVIPTCINNQETLETQLMQKTKECERLKIYLKTVQNEIAKLYAVRCEKNDHVKEFLNFAIFLTTFRDSNEEFDAISNLKDDDLLPRYDISLDDCAISESFGSDKNRELDELNSPFDGLAADKCEKLKTSSIVTDEDIMTLNSKLENAYKLLTAEISRRKQIESERENLEFLSEKLCCVLLKYQKLICPFDETKDSNILKSSDYSNENELLLSHPVGFRDDIPPEKFNSKELLFVKIDPKLAVPVETSNEFAEKLTSPNSKLITSEEVLYQVHFNCDVCGKLFLKRCDKSYSTTTSGQKFAKCPVCDAFEHNKSRDIENNTKLTDKKATMKDTEFSDADDFPETEISNVCCDICGQDYSNKHELINHIRHAHKEKKQHKCTTCGEQLAYETEFNIETRNQRSQKSFKCFNCDESFKDFTLKTGLKKHQVVHSSNKPIKCSICGQSFKRNGTKRYHEWKVHEKGDRFYCMYCNKVYRLKNNLLRHLRTDHAQ